MKLQKLMIVLVNLLVHCTFDNQLEVLYEKVLKDFHQLELSKKSIVTKKKNQINEFNEKIFKKMDLNKLSAIIFTVNDFLDFQSSFYNVFTQELFNDKISVNID